MKLRLPRFDKPTLSCLGLSAALALALNPLGAQVDNDPYMERMNPDLKAFYDELVQDMPSEEALGILSAADFSNVVYIDPSAASAGDGRSPESPLTSWTQVSWAPNTAYLQKRGTEATVSPYLSTGANDILLGAYGEGPRPILRPAAAVSGDNGTIHQGSNRGVTVRDMHIFGTGLACTIRLGRGGDITLFNNRLEDTGWGIRGHGAGSGFRIIGNLIHNTEVDGVYLQYHRADPNKVEIAWNHIFDVNTRWEDPYTDENYASGDGVHINGSTHIHIHRNVIDRTLTGNKFSIIVNRTGAETSLAHGLIEHNYLTTPRHAGDGGAAVYIQNASGWTIRHNIFDGDLEERRLGAIFNATADMTLYGNLFKQTGRVVNQGVTTRIYHNVFWDMSGAISEGGNAIVRNNIIDNRRSTNPLSGASVLENNLFTTTRAGDTSNLVGDPLFLDPDNWDFRLSGGSPAIDAGAVIIDTDIDYDRAGTPIPQGAAPDIGAFEYIGPMDEPPPRPTGFIAEPGDGEVSLSWNRLVTATGYEVKRFVSGDPHTVIAIPETNSYTDTDVVNGVTYYYIVVAVNDYGASPDSEQVSATPSRPTEWAGFEIFGGGWVDTEDWMGLFHVGGAPWIHSHMNSGWIHIEEENVSEDGSWMFIPSHEPMGNDSDALNPVRASFGALRPMPVSQSMPIILLSDDFTDPAGSLDSRRWTQGGWAAPIHIVSEGRLTIRSSGWAHYASITSVSDTFNFFLREHSVSVNLSDFPEPDWETDPANENGRREVYFVLGPASDWAQYIDRNEQYYRWEGFGFSLRWQVTSMEEPAGGGLFLRSDNEATGIENAELSGVPTGITFTVNASEFSIELEGATFVDTGLNSMSGPHALDDATWDNRYYLLVVLHQHALDPAVVGQVGLDSITVVADGELPLPTEWAGYPILEGAWVDAGEWMGLLYVGQSPWVYSERLQHWLYLREEYVLPDGAWVFSPR